MDIIIFVFIAILWFNMDEIKDFINVFLKHRQKMAEINQKQKPVKTNNDLQAILNKIEEAKIENNGYILTLDDTLEDIKRRLSNVESKTRTQPIQNSEEVQVNKLSI